LTTEPLRIFYCIPSLGLGGAERQLSYLATALADRGHEIHVASVLDGPNLDRLKAAGAAWHQLRAAGNHDPLILARLVGMIRQLKPDIVQTSLTQMDILGGSAARLTHIPWVLRESSSAHLYSRGLKNRLRFRLGSHTAAIIANSAGGMEYWSPAVAADVLHLIPNAVASDEISRASVDEGTVKTSIDHQKIVLYAGRMDSGKNVESLIVALAHVTKAIPLVTILCGDGPRRPHLQSLAEKLGVADRMIFTGYHTNVWALMKRADAFVYLSNYEGCPNVVLEGMACGCPLVVSDIPAHREILDESTAYFVNPLDTQATAAAIEAALESNRIAEGRTASAKAQVAARTIETMAARYEQVYLRVLNIG